MAICALALTRVRDGSIIPDSWPPQHFEDLDPALLFAAAEKVMPSKLGDKGELDWMRTCGILALYGLQNGDSEILCRYLGEYNLIVGKYALHDEDHWPKGISIIEIEMRRRLVNENSSV